MSWVGKVLGGAFGFMLGGPLGALAGAAFGHQFDRGMRANREDPASQSERRERIQTVFFTAAFSVMGCVAKADGRVTRDEIRLARAVMERLNLDGDLREAAERLFHEGKAPDFDLDAVLDQLRRELSRQTTLIRMFLEIQLQTAWADGTMHPAERAMLLHISKRLGIPRFVYDRLEELVRRGAHFSNSGAQRRGPTLEDAYAALAVTPDASDAEVKQAYRRLMNQHHPDKLAAKGLPEEMMKLAADKTHEIRAAYELIRDRRKQG